MDVRYSCCLPTGDVMVWGTWWQSLSGDEQWRWLRTKKVQRLSSDLTSGAKQIAIFRQLDLKGSSIFSSLIWPHLGRQRVFQPCSMLSVIRDLYVTCISLFPAFAHFQGLYYQLNEQKGRLLPACEQEGYMRLFH